MNNGKIIGIFGGEAAGSGKSPLTGNRPIQSVRVDKNARKTQVKPEIFHMIELFHRPGLEPGSRFFTRVPIDGEKFGQREGVIRQVAIKRQRDPGSRPGRRHCG